MSAKVGEEEPLRVQRPVGRPAKAGRHYRVRLTDEQRDLILGAADREGITTLSDAVAVLAVRAARQPRS